MSSKAPLHALEAWAKNFARSSNFLGRFRTARRESQSSSVKATTSKESSHFVGAAMRSNTHTTLTSTSKPSRSVISVTNSAAVARKPLGARERPIIQVLGTSPRKFRAYPQRIQGGHAERDRNSRALRQETKEPPREIHITRKVKELCQAGDLEEAIKYCRNVPTGLQGPTAWNTIIKYVLDERRYNYANELYQEMKKRAITPTSATYSTFLFAYAQASPEILTSTQLERAKKFYDNWIHLISAAPTKTTFSVSTTVHPASAYISVLANANLYQSIWDTFYELDPESRIAPDQFVFTSMFVAIAKRGTNSIPTDSCGDSGSIFMLADNAPNDRVRNAQDAKLLWRMVLRALKRKPFPVDSHLLTAALRALQGGGQAELELSLRIISDYVGLRAPDTPVPSTSLVDPKLELNNRLLGAVLEICHLAERPDLTKHFIKTLIDPKYPHPQRSCVTTGAMNHLLLAHASLGDTRKVKETISWMLREGGIPGGLEVAPGNSSWCLAFRACLSTGDWIAANALAKHLANTVKSKRTIDAETIYLVLKSAYVLNPDDKRLHEQHLCQALHAVRYVAASWPRNTKLLEKRYTQLNSGRAERRLVFQNALGYLVGTILDEFDSIKSIAAFRRLAFMLGSLRCELPAKVVARYQREI